VLALAICGLSSKVEDLIPTRVAMALLAGSTINLCVRPFTAMGHAPFIVAPVFAGFLLGRTLKWTRLPPVAWAVLAGIVPALILGPRPEYAAPDLIPRAHPLLPVISSRAVLSLALPLAMFALIANAQGRAVLRSNGFEPPARPIGMAAGILGSVHALFGAPPASLQRVAMAVLSDEGAGRTEQRWIAASVAAISCLAIAFLAKPLEAFTSSLDPAFVAAVSGVLLIRVLSDALAKSFDGQSLAGPIAFCAAISGLAMGGLSAEFWALAMGCVTALCEHRSSKTPAQ
jgi:benzoate membrane transport protein